MTTVDITTSQTCSGNPGLTDISFTIGNPFDQPANQVDLYGVLGPQPPLSHPIPAHGHSPVLHAIVPAGTYTAGAQLHLADGLVRATEISVTVAPDACQPDTTTSSIPRATTTSSPPVTTTTAPAATTTTVPEITTETSIVATMTPPSAAPQPLVEASLPQAGTTPAVVPASIATVQAATLPRTGPALIAGELGLAAVAVIVGVALVRRARRRTA